MKAQDLPDLRMPPPICWLASYPKSGSTWLRLLAMNAQARPGRSVSLGALQDSAPIASSRSVFEEHTLLDASLLREAEIEALRPAVHRAQAIAQGAQTVLAKCHDAYTQTVGGEPLLGGREAARGVLLLVRDPRDIASSLAAHMQLNLDQAVTMMADPQASLGGASVRGSRQLRQRLLNWSAHVGSWLDQTDLPVHLVRYEDLQSDTARVLRAALRFAGIPSTPQRLRQATAGCDFKRLQALEADQGFQEAPSPERHFFRTGRAGQWREVLTDAQVRQLESSHGLVMRRLGYSLSSDLRQ